MSDLGFYELRSGIGKPDGTGGMKTISMQVGSSRKKEKVLAIEEREGNIVVGTNLFELIGKLQKQYQTFPDDLDGRLENGAYWIQSKTSYGRDILLKEFSELILSLNGRLPKKSPA